MGNVDVLTWSDVATQYNPLQLTSIHCNLHQFTATCIDSLQLTSIYCNADMWTCISWFLCRVLIWIVVLFHWFVLPPVSVCWWNIAKRRQRVATHCNPLQHTATYCTTMSRRDTGWRRQRGSNVYVLHVYMYMYTYIYVYIYMYIYIDVCLYIYI